MNLTTTIRNAATSLIAGGILLLAALPASAQVTTWQIDPNHSDVLFVVRHLGVSNVHGSFGKVSGTVALNDADITKSTVSATIDTTTVDTGVEGRDKHLKSPDFFDVAKFPTMEFKSKAVTKSGDKLQLVGALTLHGVTKDVTLDLDGPTKEVSAMGKTHRGFSASTVINRKDFGLVWGGALPSGDAVVADEVKVTLEIELVK